jgi:phage terminase large subunit
LIRERFSYVWDEKAAQRGEDKPVKENDHACDAERYGIYTNELRSGRLDEATAALLRGGKIYG